MLTAEIEKNQCELFLELELFGTTGYQNIGCLGWKYSDWHSTQKGAVRITRSALHPPPL